MPDSALIELRQRLRDDMATMTDRLIVEFSETHRGEAVRRCVSRCRQRLIESGVRSGLVAATESAARLTLYGTTPSRLPLNG